MQVTLGNTKVSSSNDHVHINFGTWGYCTTDLPNGTYCSPSMVGYSPADIMSDVEGTEFSQYSRDTTTNLTRAMVLHPVATGLAFIALYGSSLLLSHLYPCTDLQTASWRWVRVS
jgi:hypothetical protein